MAEDFFLRISGQIRPFLKKVDPTPTYHRQIQRVKIYTLFPTQYSDQCKVFIVM